MSEKRVVDTFENGDALSIDFLAHVIEAALSCEVTADDLPVRMSLAASARMCLDFYVAKRAKAERETALKTALSGSILKSFVPDAVLDNMAKHGADVGAKPEWVDEVLAQFGKNGDGQ